MKVSPRLKLPTQTQLVTDDGRTMAVALATLFAAGTLIGTISLLLPHPAEFNDRALWSTLGLAAVGALAVAGFARRLPPWSMHLFVVLGTLLVTRAVYYSNEPSGFYTYLYIWVGLYAFFFFGRFWGTIHMAIVGLAFAWALTQVSLTAPVVRWMMAVGTIAIAGGFVELGTARLRQVATEAELRARALAAVDGVAQDLGMSRTPKEAATGICSAVKTVAEAKGAMLWRITSDDTGLEVVAATDPEIAGTRVLFVGNPSGAVGAFTARRALFYPDAATDPDIDKRLVEHLGVRSALFQPVMREGVPIGVIAVYWAEPVTTLGEVVSQTVTLLAAEAAGAIERAELMERLERAARTDDLTGLPNRRAWDEELLREVARSRRSGAPLCLALIDLDRFKEYNDTHGHQAGDRLLKVAASSWAGQLRDTDLLARYGGDEFALALPDCDLAEAEEMLERLRAATPESERASAGVALWDGRESGIQLFARADAALYDAKEMGRDRIVLA